MKTYDGFEADLTETVIASAIEVHSRLGPGLLESVYEAAMCIELRLRNFKFARQVTYLRITGLRVGLILNFNRPVLRDGIRRVTL
jgi:hypothetical protein